MTKPVRSYQLLFWCLAVIGLAADQASKYGIFAWLSGADNNVHVLFLTPKGGFQLIAQFEMDGEGHFIRDAHGRKVPHVNEGALFGFLRQHKTQANAGFALISLLAAVGIIAWSTFAATGRDAWLCAALGLILGGTLGNFYDRVMFGGVRDFLHWFYLFDWPVFNIADCCLVCGAGLLLLQALMGRPITTLSTDPQGTAPQPASVDAQRPRDERVAEREAVCSSAGVTAAPASAHSD
jgi:signal peptidase II